MPQQDVLPADLNRQLAETAQSNQLRTFSCVSCQVIAARMDTFSVSAIRKHDSTSQRRGETRSAGRRCIPAPRQPPLCPPGRPSGSRQRDRWRIAAQWLFDLFSGGGRAPGAALGGAGGPSTASTPQGQQQTAGRKSAQPARAVPDSFAASKGTKAVFWSGTTQKPAA